MKITLSLLLYLIRDLDPVIIKGCREDAAFEGVHQLSAAVDSLQEEASYLQIISLSELSGIAEKLSASDSLNGIMLLVSADCDPDNGGMAALIRQLPCGMAYVNGVHFAHLPA